MAAAKKTSPALHGIERKIDSKGRTGYRATVYDRRAGQHRHGAWTDNLAQARGDRLDLQVAVRAGSLSAGRSPVLRVAISRFLEGMAEGAVLNRSGQRYKPGVCRGYRSAFCLYVDAELGLMPVDRLRRRDVQALVDRIGLRFSASTTRNAIMPLRAYYRWAVAREIVSQNPTAGLELPASCGRRDRIVTAEQAQSLIALLPVHDQVIWATMFFAGLRLGETQALRIQDVDLIARGIRVVQSWDPKAGPVAPKSRAGNRLVPVPQLLIPHLDARLSDLPWHDGLIFGRGPFRAFSPSSLTSRADRLWLKARTIRVTPHQARHTFASLMIEAMVRDQTLNVKVLSEIMGHSSITVTYDRYGHLLPGSEARAVTAFDSYLESLLEDPRT